MQIAFWQWLVSLLAVAAFTQLLAWFREWLATRKAARQETEQLSTEQGFKTFFEKEILPGLEIKLRNLVIEEIRAAWRAREIGGQEPPQTRSPQSV